LRWPVALLERDVRTGEPALAQVEGRVEDLVSPLQRNAGRERAHPGREARDDPPSEDRDVEAEGLLAPAVEGEVRIHSHPGSLSRVPRRRRGHSVAGGRELTH